MDDRLVDENNRLRGFLGELENTLQEIYWDGFKQAQKERQKEVQPLMTRQMQLEARLEKAEGMAQAREKRIRDLEICVQQQDDKIEETKRNSRLMENELGTANTELKRANDDLEKAKESLTTANENVTSLKFELRAIKEKLRQAEIIDEDTYNARNAEILLRQRHGDIQSLQERIQQLESQVQGLTEGLVDNQRLRRTLSATEERVAQAQGKVEEMQTKVQETVHKAHGLAQSERYRRRRAERALRGSQGQGRKRVLSSMFGWP